MRRGICLLGVIVSLAVNAQAEVAIGAGVGGMISTYSRTIHYSTTSAEMNPFGALGTLYLRKYLLEYLCLRADYNFAYLVKTLMGAKSRSLYESIEVKPCLNAPIVKGTRASLDLGIGPELGGFLDITSWGDDFTGAGQTDPGTTGYDRAAGLIAGLCASAMLRFGRLEIGPLLSVNYNFVLWKDRETTKGQPSAPYDPSSGMTLHLQLAAGFHLGEERGHAAQTQLPLRRVAVSQRVASAQKHQ